jgi:hypothetical protein
MIFGYINAIVVELGMFFKQEMVKGGNLPPMPDKYPKSMINFYFFL